jgi:single-stranded DNA-binding protein
MTAYALLSGKLHRAPARKMSRAMQPYVQATLRVGEGDAAQWWNLVCFSDSAAEALLDLHDGDACAVSGALKVAAYNGHDGNARLDLSLFADRVISAHKPKAKPKPQPAAATPEQTAGRPFDDALPEGWTP